MTKNYYTPGHLASEFGISSRTARRALFRAMWAFGVRHEVGAWYRFDLTIQREREVVEETRLQLTRHGRHCTRGVRHWTKQQPATRHQ